MTGEILFLSHRIPFPPNRGDKIRSHHVLRALADIAPVHVGTLADDDSDMAEEGELAALAASHCLVRRKVPLVLAGLEALAQGKPVSLPAFASKTLSDYVIKVLKERPIGTIYAFSGQMGQYIPDSFKGRVIFDFVDVDSAKFEAYASAGGGPRRWVDAREGRLLRAEEARIAARADVSLFISPEEVALFESRLDPAYRSATDVRVIRNGIDSRFFDPAQVEPIAALSQIDGPRLILAGQMDYAPNVAAARRVIERLLPEIRRVVPSATFHVVGRAPIAELLQFHGRDGVHVWGAVDDIRSFLAAADLALIPLDIARGVQNKVLEAMAIGLPVVLTRAAATGFDAVDGQHLAIAESDEALVAQTLALLANPVEAQKLGRQARRFVVDNLSWQATLAPLIALIGGGPTGERHAA